MSCETTPGTWIEAVGASQMPVWDHALWQMMGGLKSNIIDDAPFFGRARFQEAGQVKLCELSSSSVAVVREARSANNGPREFVKVAVQLSGRSLFAQAGREVMLDGAGWTFYDTARPYQVVNLTQVHQFVILVPKADLHLPAAQLDCFGVQDFGKASAVGRIFPNYINSILAEGARASASEAAGLGEVATNLLRLAIAGAAQERASVSAAQTLEFQVKHYIRTHITDPELSVQNLAERFGCSKRHLHRAFAGSDISLAEFIWQSRLEHCAQALRAAAQRHLAVGEIAFAYGFNNFSHFSRAFRERFGCSPSAYRQASH